MATHARQRHSRQGNAPTRNRPRHLSCERLEERLALYAATGYSWSNPNVSFSYVPDGTSSEGYTSTLFSQLDAVAPREAWQREFARALQTWANVSNLSFYEVADSGTPTGGSGAQGAIRLAAHPLNYLAYAYYPSGSAIGGDIFLASQYTFGVQNNYDLYSVLLHESGHSLGLGHASGTVMNSSYQGILPGLTADDIAGIQSIYGARRDDAFDAAARNDSQAAATVVTLDANGAKSLSGDLSSLGDVDYFRVTAPASFDGTLRASVDARDMSLLQARVLVYDGSGTLVGSGDASTYEGKAEVNLSGLEAGKTYYVVADGAVGDAFGMGKYGLSIAFGGAVVLPPPPPSDPPPSTDPPPVPDPTKLTADRFEVNDTLASAKNLGKSNGDIENGLTLHTATDKDFFRFMAKDSGKFRVTTTYASSTGQHEIRVYNKRQAVIATSNGTSVDVPMSANEQYFLQVSSPSGTMDTYDLSIQRLAGGGQKAAHKQPAVRPHGGIRGDGLFADAASAAAAGHDHEHDSTQGSAVDQLLASWQPEQSGARGAEGAWAIKRAPVPDWTAAVRRVESAGIELFATSARSNTSAGEIAKRSGPKAADSGVGESDSKPDADDFSGIAVDL